MGSEGRSETILEENCTRTYVYYGVHMFLLLLKVSYSNINMNEYAYH